jgi:hypothetical protein
MTTNGTVEVYQHRRLFSVATRWLGLFAGLSSLHISVRQSAAIYGAKSVPQIRNQSLKSLNLLVVAGDSNLPMAASKSAALALRASLATKFAHAQIGRSYSGRTVQREIR